MPKARDLSGEKFGRLTVLEFAGSRKTSGGESKRTWLCVCDCGQYTTVDTGNLVRDVGTKSCGCLALEARTSHGMHDSRIYQTWGDMKTRCDSPDNRYYHRYGGRGISYQSSWSVFENFYEDMKDGYSDDLTLDRIDPNGNYTKENCEWVTKTKQARNKGMSTKNKSGVTGVHEWIDRKNGTAYYVASALDLNGKLKSKHFSTKKFGVDGAFILACDYRKSLIEELNSQGAGYGEHHGKEKE